MSDIFISYKREEQGVARKLANALEGEGWTVWWDPKLRAGEHFDEVIETALNEAKCVIVLWSNLSVKSEYVKAEATEALEQKKLVPIKIENVNLPLRFKRVHTPSLLDWDGSNDFSEFRKLVEDIAAIAGPKPNLGPGTVFRDTLADGSLAPEMVVIPAGTFKMGDIQGTGRDSEKPVHTVSIAKPFAIGRYPITFEEYDRFASATSRPLPNDEGWGRGRQPVIHVSWDDAVEYAKWLCEQTGKRYRLPTEAEWEYAARAGTETDYWWGNEWKSDMANLVLRTSPVGSFQPNPFGVYDTAGNVWEWVQDNWHGDYKGAPTDGSAWLERDAIGRMIRGGSWFRNTGELRSSHRNWNDPGSRNLIIGFRLVQDIP